MALTTDVDQVAWDLETLLPAAGEAGVTQLLTEIDTLARDIEGARGTVAGIDTDGLVALLDRFAQLHDLVGRVGNYAGLRFSVNTADPEIAALMQRVEEATTAVATRLLWFDLEWAELNDERAEALLADERVAFARHHLRNLRRYRPHLLSEPEEVILTEKSISGSSAWSRLFDEQTSAIAVAFGGDEVALDVALAKLSDPDPAARREVAAGSRRSSGYDQSGPGVDQR